jgi:hypothetical protein
MECEHEWEPYESEYNITENKEIRNVKRCKKCGVLDPPPEKTAEHEPY